MKEITAGFLVQKDNNIATITCKIIKRNIFLHQATGMVISNSLAINSSRPSSGSGPREEFSHVSSSPQVTRPTSPATEQQTSVAEKLAALGISSNVDYSETSPSKTPPISKPSTPLGADEEEFQPVAPAPDIGR